MSNFLDSVRAERIKKLDALKEKGVDPFPVESRRDMSIEDAVKNFDDLSKEEKELSLVGRVMSLRGQGAIVFSDLYDGSARIQVLFKKDEMKEEDFALFGETVDVGDFVEVRGKLFTTKRGEKTLQVGVWKMLSKSLHPLPDKWHGLQDTDERFRKRYLDVLMAPEVKERFVLRSKIIAEIRKILDSAGYLEVETPILQHLAGGANAEPFKTHHNALDIPLNLRIAPELYLKKLLVGGFEKVYELGRNFRNEGIDVTHNPEFTMLEFYESYADAKKQMAFVESMFRTLSEKFFEGGKVPHENDGIDFSKKFAMISYEELFEKHASLKDPFSLTLPEAKKEAESRGVSVSPSDSLEKILDNIYKKTCRPKLIQPTFIVDYPVAMNPFAKRKVGNPELIDRFQLVVGGIEVVNAFSELNDPIDQRERYLEQDKKRKGGEADVSPSDEDYLEAMEYGMPPAAGVGVGIERLIMLFTNQQNIREVLLFPTLRPKE